MSLGHSCSRTQGPLSLLQVCNAVLILLGSVRMIGTFVLFGYYHLYLLVFASKCFVFAPLLIGSTGFFSMVHGFLGIFCYFPRRHFVAYMVALGLISSAEIVSSGMFYYLKKGASEDFFSSVNAARELESYELDEAVAYRWDGLHRRYNCCGAYTTGNGNTDWNRVRIGSVPDSCCIEEYSGCGGDVLAIANDQKIPIKSLIYVEGCLTVLQRVLHLEILPILSALSFLTLLSALIQLFLVLFTFCLIRFLRNREDEDVEIISMSEFNESIPYDGPKKSSFKCCPCFWRGDSYGEFDEEPMSGDAAYIHNQQIKLKELTDWEAIEREEMLMSVLDSVLMSRRSSDGLRRSNKNIFPVRMLPIENHPSRFEFQGTTPEGSFPCFDFLYEDKYNAMGSVHPPINRVLVKEGAIPRPSRISLREDSKRVNFSSEHLPQQVFPPKKRFLSDFALPKYEEDRANITTKEVFPGQKALRRKRLSLPTNIHLKKSRSDIASEYLSMDYEESVVHNNGSSKVKGKARKLSETGEFESHPRSRYSSPSRELQWSIRRDEIIEEISLEEKAEERPTSRAGERKEERRRSSSELQREKAQSSEYVSAEQIRCEKKRSQSLPRVSKRSNPPPTPSRKISFSISPYEESKTVNRLYQRKESEDPSGSPLNHDKIYSLVFDEKSPSVQRRRSTVHENSSAFKQRKHSLPLIDSRPTTSKAFQRWASIDNQILATLPKTSREKKRIPVESSSYSTMPRPSKSMDSIRRSSIKPEIRYQPTDIQKPASVHSLSAVPKRKVDVFLGGSSFRSRSAQRPGTTLRRGGQIIRGQNTDTPLPPPVKAPRKKSLRTSEL